LMYLDTVTDSLLKGMGEQVYTMKVNIADASISLILVKLLVPEFGINGYIAVLYIAELINFSFSAARLIKRCNFKFKIFKWYAMPVISLVATAQISTTLFKYFPAFTALNWLNLIIHGVIILLIYYTLLVLSGACDSELRNWLAVSVGIKKQPDLT